MSERSRPWSGIAVGDSGPYSDDQWTDVWLSPFAPTIVSEGVFLGQTIGGSISDFAISGGVSPVTIGRGRAIVHGTWYENDANASVVISPSAGSNRITRIVLRKDYALQTVRLTTIDGVEGATPVAPPIVQIALTTWDIPLWQVHNDAANVVTVFGDDRKFIGQYNPTGINDRKVYLEDDFFVPGTTLVSGDFLNAFEVDHSGGASLTAISGLAGFGTGGLVWTHNAGGGGLHARLFSSEYKPDLMDAQLEMRFKQPNSDANLDRVLGFVSVAGTLTPVDGVYFRAAGVGNWFAVTRAGNVEAGSALDTGQAQDDVWRKFEIRQTDTRAVQFLIDDIPVANNQINIPSDIDLSLDMEIFDNGAAPGANLPYMHGDYVRLIGDR